MIWFNTDTRLPSTDRLKDGLDNGAYKNTHRKNRGHLEADAAA
jgi:hypothetical protein